MSISRKISLLLGLLALVMIFQSIDRVVHLKRSARNFESLSHRVHGTLDDIETLSRATGQLDVLSHDITATNNLEGMADHRAKLTEILRETRKAAQTLGATSTTSIELGQQMDLVATATERLIKRRAEVLRLRSENDALRNRLYADAQALRSFILPFRVRVLSGLASDSDARTAESLRLLLNLTGLLVRIEDLLVTDAVDQTEAIEADISRLISNTVTTLASSSAAVDRNRLGDILAHIHRMITREDGLGTTAVALRTALREQAAAASVLNASMYEIGTALSGLVGQSEKEIGRVYSEAAEAAESTIQTEIVFNAGLGLGIVVAVWIVFARQISGRLERLSDNVLRLASGDLAPVETPVGRDELSRMMLALEVFRRNAKELRRSNEDLANFAYVASHDLRTPLRAIRDLVDWTIEDQGQVMNPEIIKNLTLIRTRSDRLSRLLQDLLDYARAGQTTAQSAPVDVAAMVRDIGELIGEGDAIDLQFQGDAVVHTDETPLHTILLNLIGNAAKHRDRDRVTIRVSIVAIANGWDILVADDGPGIPLRYQEKVFELFKTLQSRDEVEGSGLGLAMVDKLAQHLEGSISLISNPDKERGTTFILHIPWPHMPNSRFIEVEGFVA